MVGYSSRHKIFLVKNIITDHVVVAGHKYKLTKASQFLKSGHITTFTIIAHLNHNHRGKESMIIIELTVDPMGI